MTIGFLTNDFLIAFLTNESDPEIGFWSFFFPMTLMSIITVILYHYCYWSNKIIQPKNILIHFFLVLFGIILSFKGYLSLTFFWYKIDLNHNHMTPEAKSLDFEIPIELLIAGPLLLIAGLIYFIVLLATAKHYKKTKV